MPNSGYQYSPCQEVDPAQWRGTLNGHCFCISNASCCFCNHSEADVRILVQPHVSSGWAQSGTSTASAQGGFEYWYNNARSISQGAPSVQFIPPQDQEYYVSNDTLYSAPTPTGSLWGDSLLENLFASSEELTTEDDGSDEVRD